MTEYKGLPVEQNKKEWKSGICNNCEDTAACMYSWCCYPCAVAKIGDKLGENGCAVLLCVPCGLGTLRTKLRGLYGIQGGMCTDFCLGQLCPPCALTQMAIELAKVELANLNVAT